MATKDMTQGRPLGPLCAFAFPVMVGSIVQQLYTVADGFVVGRLVGIEAFAAVGATGFLVNLLLGVLVGFVQGAGIVFGQRFGRKDFGELRRALAMAIKLSLVFAGLATLLFTLLARPVLLLIRTPADILEDSVLYSTTLFFGVPMNVFYLVFTTLLLALGDSKTHLLATAVSSLANIGLDILFVAVFRWGVFGVALGTVLAWGISLLICLIRLRKIPEIWPCKKDFSRDSATRNEILKLSLPLTLRDFVINCGGLVIQSFINGYGTLFVAGMALSERLFGVMQMVGSSMDITFATYVAQNFGNKNMARIREGFFTALKIVLIGAVIIAAVALLFGKSILGLLISGDPERITEILRVANRSLSVTAVCLPFLHLLYLFRSGIQGMGKTLIPMASGFLELAARIFAVAILPLFLGEWGIYLSSGLGWLIAALLLCFGFLREYRKNRLLFP
ncbi:MAG: MATE family efflux transporter [Oscillospiraceae bacterium]